jgi:hypothetical protein
MPSIFRDSYGFSRSCDKCQKFVGKELLLAMPLQLVLPDFPFSKWGLDFIGPINPPSSVEQVFILTTTNYFTKWAEDVPLKHSISTISHPWIAVRMSLIPISLYVLMSDLRVVEWSQTQKNIALNQKTRP